ncbi:primosomal protein N' [Alicyclobacillus macrosporangiidus]|uniref:Replication restart protein PriA n=1 Tax=Alicyclobacillus macrosporangiidus TaxID=392015 RepID=A0A1I7H8H3_9BACL|nr:primosomal protein N' [Alicyclobacillus macrosporangiidus]SFU56967.1 replication restart DNA helicase PriA [Alicyclobacillus macrosporangiidus]
MQVASVVVEIPARALDRRFDYRVPLEWEGRVAPGQRVYVTLGRRLCQAYVWSVADVDGPAARDLKPLLAVVDDTPLLTAELMDLVAWLGERYGASTQACLQAVVPAAFRLQPQRKYRVRPDFRGLPPDDLQPLWQALRREPLSYRQVLARHGPDAAIALERLLALGCIEEAAAGRDQVGARQIWFAVPTGSLETMRAAATERSRRAPRQARILEALAAAWAEAGCPPGGVPLTALSLRPSDEPVRALAAQGMVRLEAREVSRVPEAAAGRDERPAALTRWQAEAIRRLSARVVDERFSVHVLHGVTGSGKTEVYLQVMEACLAAGGGALVLVPEIALTPQMVQRFVGRFGPQVAVLHSGLSQGEKRDEWMRVRRGAARIVVGARSAVFAPVENLRLIIVDEEHEPSYKQEESPRYDAREVARWRMERCGGTLVLGSATPSLQAMHEVERGRADVIPMPQRTNGKPLPPVTVVDMREELRAGNRSLFSRALRQGLEEAVGSGRQAILFINRRGYAAFLLCRSCGETLDCPHCDISMTLHRGRDGAWLQCHYCGETASVPAVCPQCGEPALRPYGVGTQQVEQALREQWPTWRVMRMDVDTTRRKGAHQQAISRFADGDADVLVGTQMIAKGLDFPNVSFVGVVSADTMLAVPDYRAAERTFNLLTQVAGRAGRAEAEGKTVVQTYRPEHYAIQAAAHHDYAAFYRRERALREAFSYPPFCEITVFWAIHPEERLARSAAQRFERELRRRLGEDGVTVLPAVAAGVGRVEDKYRYQVVVKYSHWVHVREGVMAAFRTVDEKMHSAGGTCVLDVNAGRIG